MWRFSVSVFALHQEAFRIEGDRMIGHFHRCLSGNLLNKLQTCINRDLTKISDTELSPHLPVLFARRATAS